MIPQLNAHRLWHCVSMRVLHRPWFARPYDSFVPRLNAKEMRHFGD
jgi:hypothetical protein